MIVEDARDLPVCYSDADAHLWLVAGPSELAL